MPVRYGEPVAAIEGPRLIVTRHEHTRMNDKSGTSRDVVRGWVDVPLDSEGREDAKNLANYLSRSGAKAVVASNLTRALETGRVISQRLRVPLTPSASFRPWNMGQLQGRPYKEAIPILKRYVERHPDQPIPGGESWNDFRNRALSGLLSLLAAVNRRGITAILVTHSRNIKIIEGWIAGGQKGKEVDTGVYFKQDAHPGMVLDLRPEGGKWSYRILSRGLLE